MVDEKIIEFYDAKKLSGEVITKEILKDFQNQLQMRYGEYVDLNNKFDQDYYIRTMNTEIICRSDADCGKGFECQMTRCQEKN